MFFVVLVIFIIKLVVEINNFNTEVNLRTLMSLNDTHLKHLLGKKSFCI